MQSLSPVRWDHTVCPCSFLVPTGPGGLPAQRPAQQLQPDSLCGSMWSLQVPAPPLLPLTQVLHSAGQPPRAPQSAGGHPCPILAASPCSQLLEVVSGQAVRRIRREAGRCKLVSVPSSDLGPPSLSLTLPTTRGSSPLCPHQHYTCSCRSAVDQNHQGRGSECRVLGSIPKDLMQEVT